MTEVTSHCRTGKEQEQRQGVRRCKRARQNRRKRKQKEKLKKERGKIKNPAGKASI